MEKQPSSLDSLSFEILSVVSYKIELSVCSSRGVVSSVLWYKIGKLFMYFFGDDGDTILDDIKVLALVFRMMLINYCSSFLVPRHCSQLICSAFASSETYRRTHGFLWVIHLEWGGLVRVEKLIIWVG